jgi:hypothetical protein
MMQYIVYYEQEQQKNIIIHNSLTSFILRFIAKYHLFEY